MEQVTERRPGRADGRKVRWLQFVNGPGYNAQVMAAGRYVSRGVGSGRKEGWGPKGDNSIPT